MQPAFRHQHQQPGCLECNRLPTRVGSSYYKYVRVRVQDQINGDDTLGIQKRVTRLNEFQCRARMFSARKRLKAA